MIALARPGSSGTSDGPGGPSDLIAAALRQFSIDDFEATALKSNESVSAKVVDRKDGRSYLLRVHEPSVGGLIGVQHTFEGLGAEMVFRSALAAGMGLTLQKPVANRDGGYVSSVVDKAGKRALLCTLLTWVDGHGLTGQEENAASLVREFGSTIARMHRFASAWDIPVPFIRPVYDNAKYAQLASRLAYGVDAGLFSEDAYKTIIRARQKTGTLLRGAARSSDRWGIIHADLHTGNLIVSSSAIVPIDFSFCGYGYYLFDLSICLSSLKPHLRGHLLEGYRTIRDVSEQDRPLLDGFFLEGIIGAFAFHIFNERQYEWIARRLPEVAATYCADYLAGRPVLSC